MREIHLGIFYNISGYNNIGDDGCAFLSQANWPKLQVIVLRYYSLILDGCKIGDNGAIELGKAKWSSLQTLVIG